MYDVIIIGAGVIGSFIAHALCRYQLNLLVLEKESDVGSEASMANSAIIHSGYDPLPHTNKAKFNVKGNAIYDQICQDLDVPFERIGSLTLAFSKEEEKTLYELVKRGQENGVTCQILSGDEVRKLEPHISKEVVAALFAPTAGIINPFLLTAHLMEHATDHGTQLHLCEKVVDIEYQDGIYEVKTEKGLYQTRAVINAAGVYADEITSFLTNPDYQMTPRKGEYFVLEHFDSSFLHHTLFTLPTEKGKGVLISPTTSQNYLVGPSSEPSNRDDFSTDSITLEQIKKQAERMMDHIPFQETIRVFSGVRPTASKHDFIIEEEKEYPRFIEVAGIESPGLASAPAIAEEVVSLLKSRMELVEKKEYVATIRPYVVMKNLTAEEKKKKIQENPLYGKMICHCEQISEQEIRDLFHRSFVPHSIIAIKKRVRAGFGKCQGGMCQPLLIKIMAEELHLPPTEICYHGPHSEILKYPSKEEK